MRFARGGGIPIPEEEESVINELGNHNNQERNPSAESRSQVS